MCFSYLCCIKSKTNVFEVNYQPGGDQMHYTKIKANKRLWAFNRKQQHQINGDLNHLIKHCHHWSAKRKQPIAAEDQHRIDNIDRLQVIWKITKKSMFAHGAHAHSLLNDQQQTNVHQNPSSSHGSSSLGCTTQQSDFLLASD